MNNKKKLKNNKNYNKVAVNWIIKKKKIIKKVKKKKKIKIKKKQKKKPKIRKLIIKMI